MQNKLSGYKTTIIKILEKVYGRQVDLVTSNNINDILKFLNDIPDVWNMLTSKDIYKYKPLNDKRLIDDISEGGIPKEYALRHICEAILNDKETSSKLQQVFKTALNLYKFEGTTPSGKQYISDYYKVMGRVAEFHNKGSLQTGSTSLFVNEVKCHKKRIDEEIMKACNDDKISLKDADAIIRVGAFIADVFISYYTDKKTKYMDTNFKKCPKFSSIKWFMFKYKF